MARVARRLSWFVANVVEQLLQIGYGSEKACQILARRSWRPISLSSIV
jgi:hypothetical protein